MRERIRILVCHCIESTVVNAQTIRAIFLPYQYDVDRPGTGSRFNQIIT